MKRLKKVLFPLTLMLMGTLLQHWLEFIDIIPLILHELA